MTICDGDRLGINHEEIVHEDGDCPLCAEISNREEIEKERDKLQEELDNQE